MTAQLRPLLSLRWTMVRSPRSRTGFLALAASAPGLCLVAAVAALMAEDDRRGDVILLAPSALIPVALLAVVAPLVAGGGNELFPDDQLTAYPVTARTRHAASLLLSPLNLAWTTQVVGLVGLAAYVADRRELVLFPVLTLLAYVAMVTVAGQAVAWLVVGVRQRPLGRAVTWGLTGVAALAGLAAVVSGNVGEVLDRSPTTPVVIGALNGSSAAWASWSVTTGVLVAMAVAAHLAGRRAATWALGRTGDAAGIRDAQVVRRRPAGSRVRAQLLALDRASVWRSPSLRRGLLVLGILPGLVAAVAGLEWASLVLLPGLVAAGAGLLFGVNAFCLDGSGAVWLESLPGKPARAVWSKAQVVGEVCLVAVAVTVLAGSLRAGRAPTASEAVALLACAATTVLRVVATCMELSVRRPYRADLRGPRETPAPPGVMAAYSVRLALSTTLVGIVLSGLAGVADWWWPAAVATPLCLLGIRRLLAAARAFTDPVVRSRVVTTVASG